MEGHDILSLYADAFSGQPGYTLRATEPISPVEILPTLRFLTCGSVDDGKSTLIGRILYEARQIYDDQLISLRRDSSRFGTTGDDIDFALLTDGLEAEREQGITLDVAYRFFSTGRRSFIVADTPGHEQYTRNMATGASTADLAVIVIDARKGILSQTRRHAHICSLLGIRSVVLAINKIDLIEDKQKCFRAIHAEFGAFANSLGFEITPIPISARYGDNVGRRSSTMPWYEGPTLVEHLEAVRPDTAAARGGFRFAVQWVNRPNLDFRGYSGTIRAGHAEVGAPVLEPISGRRTSIARIIAADCERERAGLGEAVTLVLADEIDLARGDLVCRPGDPVNVADQFAAHIVWFDTASLLVGREYIMKIGARSVPATISEIGYVVDIEHFQRRAASKVNHNEIASCHLATNFPIAFDAYGDNRHTGGFILIDRLTNATAGAGMIVRPLSWAGNLHPQKLGIDQGARGLLLNQKPAVLWFTGLSGSGKSTIADLVERKLYAAGHLTYLLDGDNIRLGLNRDLGFSEADRVENIRRVGEMARLMSDAGLIVLCCFISPFIRDRNTVRSLFSSTPFLEIFVDTSLETCMKRDPKGLYAKAKRGEIENFTGLDSPYEQPPNPDLRLYTESHSADGLAEQIVARLGALGLLRA